MRKINLLLATGFVVFALASCQDKPESGAADSSIVTESSSTTALTASVVAVFSNLDVEDINYGSFGILYTDAEDADALFASWKDGDNSVLDKIKNKPITSHSSDGRMKATITGLDPETTYSFCPYFQSEDKTRRKIGKTSTFTTSKFTVTIRNDGAQSVKFYSASIAGTLDDITNEDCSGCAFGMVMSTFDNPTVENGRKLEIEDNVSKRQYVFPLTSLTLGTKYYYRPYVRIKKSGEYIYGDVQTFSTKEADEMAVDLGLSVLWSKYFLGSEEEGKIGDYYRWGEVEPLRQGVAYALFDTLTGGIKDIGVEDISGTQYDAATHKLGGKWRMPTIEEIQELIDNTDPFFMQGTASDGLDNKLQIRGYRTGNVLVLPQCGYYYSYDVYGRRSIYNSAYGYFYFYSSSYKVQTQQRSGYYILDSEALDRYLDASGGSASIETLIALGLIEYRTETYTGRFINYVRPGDWLDIFEPGYDDESLLDLTVFMTSYGDYAYQILPVRDRD